MPNAFLTDAVSTLYMTCGVWSMLIVGTSPALWSEFFQVWFPGVHKYLKENWVKTNSNSSGNGSSFGPSSSVNSQKPLKKVPMKKKKLRDLGTTSSSPGTGSIVDTSEVPPSAGDNA
ncbi:hypothetical protein HK102_010766 [Quaeritorhiza haematococci]|nr:hypothetical protein HK102_010766 [Quaeritorhiza haematococci]